MGVGNYLINGGKTVYIDHEQIYGAYDLEKSQYVYIEFETDYEELFDQMVESFIDLMPESYDVLQNEYSSEGARIIAENGFYTVQVKDWEGYVAVSIVLKEDELYCDCIHPLAEYHLDTRATTLFDTLANGYQLRLRTCSWTTGPYVASTSKAA